MDRIAVRLNAKEGKSAEAILDFFGAKGESESERWRDLLTILSDKREQALNSQNIGERLGNQQKPIDLTCNLRFSVKEQKRSKAGTVELVETFYCVYLRQGKPIRQIKLVSPVVCEICSILREQWSEEPEEEIIEAPANPTPVYVPTVAPTLSAPIRAPAITQPPKPTFKTIENYLQYAFLQNTDGSRICPFKDENENIGLSWKRVFPLMCERCRKENPEKSAQCKEIFAQVQATKIKQR